MSCFCFYNGHTSGCAFVCEVLCTTTALSSYNYNKLKIWKLVLYWIILVFRSILKSASLRIQLVCALFSCAVINRIFSVASFGSQRFSQSPEGWVKRAKWKWVFPLCTLLSATRGHESTEYVHSYPGKLWCLKQFILMQSYKCSWMCVVKSFWLLKWKVKILSKYIKNIIYTESQPILYMFNE